MNREEVKVNNSNSINRVYENIPIDTSDGFKPNGEFNECPLSYLSDEATYISDGTIDEIFDYFELREKEYQNKLIEANSRGDKFLKENRDLSVKADILRNIEFVIDNPDAIVRKG